MTSRYFAAAAASMLMAVSPGHANNLGENGAWQFRSASDLAAQAAALEVLERKRSGSYSAPSFTTNIARQFNCSNSASALGNSGGQSAVANSPSVTGTSANAGGNASDAALEDGRDTSNSAVQDNSGAVTSGAAGNTDTAVSGTSSLALNSKQSNSGDQSARLSGSTACTFGALN